MLQRINDPAAFGLRDGQMRSDINGDPFAKNQWWCLESPGMGVMHVGYGDLSEDDVLRIAEELADDEVFTTFNEYDGNRAHSAYSDPFQMGMVPRMVITNRDLEFPRRTS